MPELPEVEAVCRKLRREAAGASIAAAKILRPSVTRPQPPRRFETAVAGTRIEAVDRRGKNILLRLSGGLTVRVHLRMTGDLRVIPDARFRPATVRAWMEFEDGRGLVFDDPRALGKMHLHRTDGIGAMDGEIGVEPLSPAFTREYLAAAARGSRKPAKLFLMDQKRVAGLGNIYAAEALFRARVHPERPIGRLGGRKIAALHGAIVEVLEEAVQSAVAAYSSPGESGEGEWFACAVYGRAGEPCRVCGRKIRRIPQGGRSTYYCPGCQRA